MKRMWTKKEMGEIASDIVADETTEVVNEALSNGDIAINNTFIESGEATEGQVLTADGNGGCSWEDASGGDSKYLHIVTLVNTSYPEFAITMDIINDTSDDFTPAAIAAYLRDKGFNASNKLYPCSTHFTQHSGSDLVEFKIYGAYSATSSNLYFYGSKNTYSLSIDGSAISISAPTEANFQITHTATLIKEQYVASI